MRHILSLLLENEPGALSRVAGLISARGYNIESLSVAPTDDASLSRMTLVTRGDEQAADRDVGHEGQQLSPGGRDLPEVGGGLVQARVEALEA